MVLVLALLWDSDSAKMMEYHSVSPTESPSVRRWDPDSATKTERHSAYSMESRRLVPVLAIAKVDLSVMLSQ